MRKIHITLLGREAAPVYNAIMATSPDYIVYIHSESSDSIKALNALKREIATDSESHLLSPTDPFEIKNKAETLAQKFKEDSIVVNITSGLKSWAYWFGILFDKQPNASIVYIDQNNVLWNYSTMAKIENFQFDMKALFRLYGNSIDGNCVSLKSYTKEDESAITIIEELRKFNFQEFNSLVTTLPDYNRKTLQNSNNGFFQTIRGSSVKWEKPAQTGDNGKAVVCIKKNDGTSLNKEIKSPHIIDLLFNSGWFEYKVAKIISEWPKAKEIFLNCHFPFRTGVDKNEVDIIVNTGTKVLFVECKTQIYNTIDIDKFRNVIKTYGGMGSKGLFVTDAVMKDNAIQKCEENSILHFSLQEPSLFPINKALSLLLDSELYNINAR